MKLSICGLVAASVFVLTTGCSQQSPLPGAPETSVTLNPESGKFGISHLSGLSKAAQSASIKEGANVNFDLGSIKGSTGFFFLLYNVGVTPITDVTLSIDNQGFSVFPNSMDTLIPGSDVGMLPIVKVSAFHGTALDGIGARPVLPMGDNAFTLRIQGKSTTSNGTDTIVEMEAEMHLEALVMEYEVRMMHHALDLASPRLRDNESFNLEPALINKEFASFIGFCMTDTAVTIANTGNTPIHLDIYQLTRNEKVSADEASNIIKTITTTIVPGANGIFPVNTSITAFEQYAALVISGENCITDPSRVYQSADGKCYINITANNTTCEDVEKGLVVSQFILEQKEVQCPKMFAQFYDTLLFYAQECADAPYYSYRLYSVNTGAAVLLYSRSGSAQDNLTEVTGDTSYSELFDIILPLVINKSDFKGDLGLGGSVSCTFDNWLMGSGK